jgi:hypothetical protein
MGFNLDNYEQVKDRITRFYHDHPDGSIQTELVSKPDTLSKEAAFRAIVYIAGSIKATGYAYEAQGQGVNKDAWVENAETSAIGRALANMDYCGTMRPSREEMSKVSPKPTQPDARINFIKETMRELCPTEEEYAALRAEIWAKHNGDLNAILRDLEGRQLEASGRKTA